MDMPRVYLAVDNCFALKRWTSPDEWCSIIKNCGARYIEVSADNEADPLYSEENYMKDWLKSVNRACEKNDTEIANFYSGHGTYTLLGLANPDTRNRQWFIESWMYPFIRNASQNNAGLGFFCHAFKNSSLQSYKGYCESKSVLYDSLKQVALFAKANDVPISLEQMYTPHQFPWRITDCIELLRTFKSHDLPIYITVDVGHQFAQKEFMKPTKDELMKAISDGREIYCGPDRAQHLLRDNLYTKSPSSVIQDIVQAMDECPHLFANAEDTNIYHWISELGCYSPIIHLQQTDNTSSAHKDFTAENNSRGSIDPKNVLSALAKSYAKKNPAGMPDKVKKIYLTLELFFGTAEYSYAVLDKLQASVRFWRRTIPEDGISLDKLMESIQDSG